MKRRFRAAGSGDGVPGSDVSDLGNVALREWSEAGHRSHRVSTASTHSKSLAAFIEQLLKVLFPDRGPGVGAMAVSLLGSRNQHELAPVQALDFALGNA